MSEVTMLSRLEIVNNELFSVQATQCFQSYKESLLVKLTKIIHDFKNPLQIISILCNNIEPLVREYSDSKEVKYLKSLSDYLLYMIEDINEYTRRNINNFKLSPVSFISLL